MERNGTNRWEQVIRIKKLVGLPPPALELLGRLFLGSEEPSLRLLRSAKLQRTNSCPITNCRRSKSAIFLSRNINYHINSLLRLYVGMHIIYIYIYIYIRRALHTGSRKENNIGLPVAAPKKVKMKRSVRAYRICICMYETECKLYFGTYCTWFGRNFAEVIVFGGASVQEF